MTASRSRTELVTRPLTLSQRVRLLFGASRVVFVLAPFGLYVFFLTGIFGRPPLAFYLLVLAVALFVGYDSLKDLRDLIHGRVEVREDVLLRSRSGSPGRHCFGEFQTLGKVSMSRRAHFGSHAGAAHRVVYSPISRFVWSAEPMSPYG